MSVPGGTRPIDTALLAARIDSTLLTPTVGLKALSAWLEEQRPHGFAAVCVAPFAVPLAVEILAGSPTAVCSVCAFPLGYAATESKAEEAARLVELGCREVDVVMNVAAFLEGEHAFVRQDLRAVLDAVREAPGAPATVKVILETGYLSPDDIRLAASLAADAGAAFVKTSTGFGPRGASVEDVRLMRGAIGADVGVKAAGGIRDLEAALAMLDAGATRLGTSAAVEIVRAARAAEGGTA